MVQALIQIDDNTNRVLNVVKAKYGLNDKSKAIQLVVNKFIEAENEPELRPEYIGKLQRTKKQKGIKFKSIDDLREHIKNA